MDEHDQVNASGGSGADDPTGIGRVVEQEIERELRDSYLLYAMSTIMDRALPDVRDGLKPSQRRILVAMNDLKLRPGSKHRKSSKITGDTQGNYHPHGTQVIYPTLVGLAQSWRMRVPLVDPQGNFGSIDGDPPAAERYTEARMSHAAMDLLADMHLDTVDMQPNYDDTRVEPVILPGKFPNLLVNGGIGIAVGMATSLAPHNPGEVIDAILRVLDRPDIEILELMTDELDDEGNVVRMGLKGPDFPTGGVILGRRGIVDAYTTGRGKLTVRGETHVETAPNGRESVVIDSIPYGLNQTNLMERIVDAVKDDRIKDISDVRNESGREAQSRIVIELKKGADAAVVENQLLQYTPLQQTVSVHNIALVNRQPRTLTIKGLIEHYIEHRRVVIRRRTEHLLREAKKRAHVLEGMIYAVCDLDEVIRLIRSSRTRTEAIEKLMERRFRIAPDHAFASMIPARLMDRVRAFDSAGGVLLTRVQAEQIGSMRLIQLVGLEIEKLVNEYRELVATIEDYESILADPERVRQIIREDCEELRLRHASGEAGARRTSIEEAESDLNIEALIQEHTVAVTISRLGYVKRVPADTYRQQGRGGKGISGGAFRDEDFTEHLFVASTHDDLLCFTDQGRVFRIKVYELPEMSRQSKGRPIVNVIGGLRQGEAMRAFLAVKNFERSSQFLAFVSRGGLVKRTALKEYRNVHRGGLIAVGLREGDALLDVVLTDGEDDLLLATSGGMAIRFNENDARLMGRGASGVKGIELGGSEHVVGVVRVPMQRESADDDGSTSPAEIDSNLCLLTITENGYGKRTPVDEYRVQQGDGSLRSQGRGGKGRQDIKTSARNGSAVVSLWVHESDDLVVTTRQGMMTRVAARDIRQTGRGTQGVRVVSLKSGDQIIAAARVADSNGNGDGADTVGEGG